MLRKAGKSRKVLRLIQEHPVFVSLVLVVTLVTGIQMIWTLSTRTVDLFGYELSLCLFSADRYEHSSGYFEKTKDQWIEFDGINIYTFMELERDFSHVYLADPERGRDPSRPFLVRLPKCGGAAEWTYPNPEQWTPFREVAPVRD